MSNPTDHSNYTADNTSEKKLGQTSEPIADKAKKQAETGLERGAEQIEKLSDAVDEVAASLKQHDIEGLANYARQSSEKLARLAKHLQEKSVDELTNDAKALARHNPAAFILGSVALGFGLSRFLKSSEQHQPDDEHEAFAYHTSDYGTPADPDQPVTRPSGT